MELQVNVSVNGNAIPFDMKIGDAGEAFFVFETEGDVPADLITSPILHPTGPSEPGGDIPQDRFGAKRKDDAENMLSEESDAVREPDFLDLNDAAVTSTDGAPLSDLPSAAAARQIASSSSDHFDDGKTPTSSPRPPAQIPSGLSLSKPSNSLPSPPPSPPPNPPTDNSDTKGPQGAIDRAVQIEPSEVHVPDVQYKPGTVQVCFLSNEVAYVSTQISP